MMRYTDELGRGVRILVGVSVSALAFALSVPPAGAETATSAISATPRQPSKHSKVVKRPPVVAEPVQSAVNRYFIEFRSRAAASYGHMYVLYGQVNERDQIVRSEIAGLHPAGDANNCDNCSAGPWTIGHVIFVPAETGASDGDLEEKYVTSRYRVMLDEAQYRDVAAYIKKLQANNPLWNALWRNCVSFGKDIADHMGLKTPAFTWLEPKNFVDDLREMNGGSAQEPLADATASPETENPVAAQPHTMSSKKSSTRQKPKKQLQTTGMAAGAAR
jgi:hypothetical protein